MNSVENETDQESGLSERLKSISSVVISVITAVLVAFVGYIMVCSARGKAVEVFGRCILKVVTGSMEPSLHVGDYIYVKKADADTLAEGDIISFYSEEPDIYGRIVTHRIKEVQPDGTYVTQGDANSVRDSKAVRYDQIIGKYQGKARFYRWIGSFGDRKKLLLILVIIPMTLIALYEVKTITKLGIEVKRENELSAEDKEKLIREAIDREKEKLALEGFTQDEPPPPDDETAAEENSDAEEEGSEDEASAEEKTEAPVISGVDNNSGDEEEVGEEAGSAEEDSPDDEECSDDENAQEDEELKLPEKEVDTVESGKDNEG